MQGFCKILRRKLCLRGSFSLVLFQFWGVGGGKEVDAYLSFSDYATTWKENMIIFLTTNRVSSDVYMGKHQTLLTTCDSTNLTYIIQCKRCKKKNNI